MIKNYVEICAEMPNIFLSPFWTHVARYSKYEVHQVGPMPCFWKSFCFCFVVVVVVVVVEY